MKITLITACAFALATTPALFAKKPADKQTPGKTEESAATAAGAVPTTPGAYKKLPCPKKPAFTYDIYLPQGYTPSVPAAKANRPEAPGEAFPALFISSPHKNPGFRGLEKWADENKVILVTINDSENGEYSDIKPVQEAVFDAVKGYDIHPCLRFATGFSGAGAASANIMFFHPKEFAGVIIQCHSVFVGCPQHIAYGYIGGLSDTTQSDFHVREGAALARKGGRYVQEAHLPQGHDWAPANVLSGMLTNMLFYARLSHPGLSPAEKKSAEKIPDTLLARAASESDPVKVCAALDPLVSVESFKRRPFYPVALDAWCAARVKTIGALSGVNAFEALVDKDTADRFDDCRGKSKPAVDALRKKIEAEPALKYEAPAWKDFQNSWTRSTGKTPGA